MQRNHRLAFLRAFSVALVLTICLPGVLWSQYFPPPLLLSFNLASDWDVATLEKLQLQQQATYFVTPQVARAYSDFIRKLSEKNTIGLLYTGSTTSGNRFEVRQEIAAARQALSVITGEEPVWFRSVPDKWHKQTVELAREAGFKYDSSESERKLVQDVLAEFPIAASASGIWQSIALWKEEYRKRTITGRPYIVQVGIHTIDAYPKDLQAFIDFVKNNGGRCLTYDAYLRTLGSSTAEYSGIYLDLSKGLTDPEQVVVELTKAGVTDVFLMAQDAAGQKFYQSLSASGTTTDPVFVLLSKRLRAAGIRVHAWIAVNRNEQLALNYPEFAMVDVRGRRSTKWISPSHPKNAALKLTVHELIVNHDLDGIHLDYLGYPSLDFDFSEQAIRGFEQDYGEKISRGSPQDFHQTGYRDKWNRWRAQQLQAIVLDAASTISGFSAKRLILSGALDAAAVTDHRQMEASAQDLSLLANGLDLIVVKLDLPSLSGKLWGKRLAITPRLLAGNRPLLLASPLTRSSVSNEISWAAQMESARPWVQGVAYGYGGPDVHRPEVFGEPLEAADKAVLADSQVVEGSQPQQVAGRVEGEVPGVPQAEVFGEPLEAADKAVLADSRVVEGSQPQQVAARIGEEVSGVQRSDAVSETTGLADKVALPDSRISDKPQSKETAAETNGSIFSTLRFILFLIGVVVLLMLFALRSFILRREKEDIGEQPLKEEENVSTVGLAEFLAGFIYTVKQITPDPGIGQAGSKMVVILTSGDHFTMFHINPEREASAPLASQVPVTPHDIPKLSEEAYVDTTRLIEGNEDGFRIVGLVGLVPDKIKKTIRAQIAGSLVIPRERQEQILREFN